MGKNLLEAIDLAVAGQWDAAHQMVQQYETDPTAAWIGESAPDENECFGIA